MTEKDLKQKDKYVQGYVYNSNNDERNGNICQIIGRGVAEGSLLEQGSVFKIRFGDGTEDMATGDELSPWFPT